MSSQASREDEENCSNKATNGSSDPGSDDLELLPTRSRSSERELQRPMNTGPVQHLQAARTNHPDATDATRGISSVDSSSLMGLMLSPLPSAMLPNKKRSLVEVLDDESPPQKDKMSDEIDELASGHQRKKSKAHGEPSTSRAPPTGTRDSATSSDERENRPQERRSESIHDATRHRNLTTSG
ncbi:hypothetical protein F4824DRAFT_72788 [Ustulina deusta]|nr:hypothetical protein F4824DRAFT_72788 [Ustulina deusta]